MKAQIVSFHCVLKDKMGNLISSTFNHDVITQTGGNGGLLKAFAEGLNDLKKGDKRRICLSAHQAYGFYNQDLVMEVSRKSIARGQQLRVGHQVYAQAKNGETKLFRVTQAGSDVVTLDANHPLAGQDLVFFIDATDAREATSEEVRDSEKESAPVDLPRPSPKYLH
jgi:FKBP-type peptidyl-prolyl cis-trans isomerase SlyD